MGDRDDRGKRYDDLTEKDKIGLRGGTGDVRIGLDTEHLKVDGHGDRDDKIPHDKSWKTRAELVGEEADQDDA